MCRLFGHKKGYIAKLLTASDTGEAFLMDLFGAVKQPPAFVEDVCGRCGAMYGVADAHCGDVTPA